MPASGGSRRQVLAPVVEADENTAEEEQAEACGFGDDGDDLDGVDCAASVGAVNVRQGKGVGR